MEHPDEILAELARHGETRTWEPGTAVIREGEVADCLYIVHAGELRPSSPATAVATWN